MGKKTFVKIILIIIASFCFYISADAEDLTITTYYPAPSGVYREIRNQRMAIGENYYDPTICWYDLATCPNGIPAATDLVVEGNVGIGTTSPSVKFHVVGTTGAIGDLAYFESIDNNAPIVQLYRQNNLTNLSTGAKIGSYHFGGYFNNTYTPTSQEVARVTGYYLGDGTTRTGALIFETSNSGPPAEVMRIDNLGNVGIGTTNPQTPLHVYTTGNFPLFLETSQIAANSAVGAAFSFNAAGGDTAEIRAIKPNAGDFKTDLELRVHDGSWNTGVYIKSNGNVGIGTTSPAGALDVTSTTGALIVPRMTTAQRDALTGVNGMIIYNTSTGQFNFYEGGVWVTK